ncbi:amidohydrolase family protein [Ruegeria sp. 2012CJ41-6]|uniref:Amidohydrolase family protein n=1 Tax=Ruegeria spongiae TaxID=2942209 RepID=A0ABT0Q265_9RHOB|nr:amidohydrolase family protein [Ruegeria spongiae]MCL6283926.1 amidohydrolase family protein [Ruegeria spongiae]
MKIDAHQHFWQPLRGDYHWMPKDEPILNRPYAPADLEPHLRAHAIQASVLVQAAATLEETEYMLGLADATPFIKGVVGWVDFENPDHHAHLVRLANHPKFAGVRPMIQDIGDVNWMLRDDIQWAFRAVMDLDLTFDALGFPRHIPNFLTLMTRYPGLRVVYDHCMKPQIRDQRAGQDAFADWADGMSRLADQTTGCCKLSGLVTEAGADWTIEDLHPFAMHVLDAFGADRVMFGSDWPVCRLTSDYDTWYETAQALTSHLNDAERADIFGGTAARFYRLT